MSFSPLSLDNGYASVNRGDLSHVGNFIGVVESIESLPAYAVPKWGPSCVLASDASSRKKVPLSGSALQQYNSLKQQLESNGDLTCPSCSGFFHADPTRLTYFSELTQAVTRQVPYDGLQTNISAYDAGMFANEVLFDPRVLTMTKNMPVCGYFITYKSGLGVTRPQHGQTAAASQLISIAGGPATDVYINPNLMKMVSQGTILHEAMHNLTGDYDNALELLLGLTPDVDCKNGTICITNKLQSIGCASPN